MPWESFQGVGQPSDLDLVEVLTDPESPQAETLAQVKAAKAAVKAILKSGALGQPENLHVFLSGHANPGHRPTGGQHDTITVSISVGKYRD